VKATVWGCRGSLPTPGPRTVGFGGNTSCVSLELDDRALVVLDAGTGIHELGLRVDPNDVRPIHVCLTHLHLDHLEGLRFFAPLWRPESEIHIWGPPSPVSPLFERIARSFSPPLFPVQLSDVPCSLSFHDVPGGEWRIGPARLLAEPVIHPGPTLGYRIDGGGRTLAYIPDHEPFLGGENGDRASEWLSGYAVAADADVLMHDAQYTAEEYASRVGWGHSSVDQTVRYARAAGAKRLVLFHHDPLRSDNELAALREEAAELWGAGGPPPELAEEGMEIRV
jgi:phosphoribosyl 1,2-cyclic phosphodiesterase